MALLADGLAPLSYQKCQPARVFVIARHCDVSLGESKPFLFFRWGQRCGVRSFQHLQGFLRL
jgi:hypothetical protein